MSDVRILRQMGFSLIEILTVLAILGILCCLCVPSLSFLYKKNQLDVMADDIKQAIHFAKIEALANHHTLVFTPLSESDDWSKGMRLFVDNKAHRATPKTTLLREWHWGAGLNPVVWHGFESRRYLRISPFLVERGANGYFLLQRDSHQQIKLVLNRLARVRQERLP